MTDTPQHSKQLMKELSNVNTAHDVFSRMTASRSPDKIILQRGRGVLDYYDVMVDADPVLAGLLETRVDAVAGLGWDVVSASDDDSDEKIAEFIRFGFGQLKRFKQDLEQILSAARTGFSVCEIVWDLVTWEGQQKWVPVKLLSRRPERFTFDEEYNLRLKTRTNSWDGEELPPNKFIHHIFRPRYENPYGTSLCTSVWWMWWFKHHGMAWWLKAAERGAVVTPIGYYPEGWNENQIEDFKKFLRGIMGDSYGALPEGSNVDFPQIKIDPEFASALREACNEEMIYRVLGGTQSSAGNEGSRAKAQVHEHRFQERKEADAESVMATINDQLVKPMVLLNFPEPQDYPFWRLLYDPEKDTSALADVLIKAAKIKIPVAVGDAAEMLNLPLAEEGEQLIEMTQAPSPFMQDVPAGKKKDDPQDPDEEPDDNPDEGEAVNPKIYRLSFSARKRAAKYIDNQQKLIDGAIKKSKPVMDDILKQVKSWVKRQKTIENAAENANSFKLDSDKLAAYLLDARYYSMLMGFHDFTNEPDATVRFNLKKWFYQKFIAKYEFEPLPFQDAIKLFEDRSVMDREDFDTLLSFERRNALTAAGMSAETIEHTVRSLLVSALKEGMTLPDFIGNLQLPNVVHAENIFRTNMSSAYNNGHMEGMFYPGYEDTIAAIEFIAIMDGRETDICRERHGKLYKLEDLKTAGVAPPLHFQCRSTIVEVFADELEGREISGTPSVPAQSGFGEFQPVLEHPPEPQSGIDIFVSMVPHLEKQPDFVKETWEEIRKLAEKSGTGLEEIEHGAIFDRDGFLLEETGIVKGDHSSVRLPMPVGAEETIIHEYPGLMTTHSHPLDTTFSAEDMINMWANPMETVSVVVGEYSIQALKYRGFDVQTEVMSNPIKYQAEVQKIYDAVTEIMEKRDVGISDAMEIYINEHPEDWQYQRIGWDEVLDYGG